ncbi:MAG: hypothetical protein ACRD68_16345 [Pyrinomonadaceae bacterium]
MKKFFMFAAVAMLGLSIAFASAGNSASAIILGDDDDDRPRFGKKLVEVPVVFQAAGSNRDSILSSVDAFRNRLGALNPNVPGSFGTGRREINWDGVPDNFAAPNNFPPDFFNVNSPRGAVFSTPGAALQVSADNNNPTNTPVRFANINPAYADIFATFSPQRLFTAIDSNVSETLFFVPGTDTPATVSGFGAVFTDVDLPAGNNRGRARPSTRIEFFDAEGRLLFVSDVPSSPGSASLSFLGVVFPTQRIARVRITSGNVVLEGADGGRRDVVAMDDFIYGEPSAAQ